MNSFTGFDVAVIVSVGVVLAVLTTALITFYMSASQVEAEIDQVTSQLGASIDSARVAVQEASHLQRARELAHYTQANEAFRRDFDTTKTIDYGEVVPNMPKNERKN